MAKPILFEGQHYSFPDDATDEEISQSLMQMTNNQPASNNNVPQQEYQDTRTTDIPKSMGLGLAKLYNRVPEEAKGLEHLIHLGRAFTGVTNPASYLNKIPQIENIAEKVPEFDIEHIKEKWGRKGHETIADDLIQGLLQYLPETAMVSKGALSLGKGALNVAKGIKSKNIAKEIAEGRQAAKDLYKERYGDFFNKAREAGIDEIEKPPIYTKLIEENSSPKYHKTLQDFMEEPTLENAHWAQSDMGKFIRHMEKIEDKQGLTKHQHNVLKEARNAQKELKESMFDAKRLGGNNKLAEQYNTITKGYAEDVIPYTTNTSLTKYVKGTMSPEELLPKLYKDHAFMQRFKKEYPNLELKKAINSPLGKKIVLGLLTSGTGYEVLKHASK